MKLLTLLAIKFWTLMEGSRWFCSLIISIWMVPIIHFFEKYFFCDWEFMGFLGVLIIGDTIFGFISHYKAKTLSSEGFAKFFKKLFLYFSVLILTHVLTHFKINGHVCNAFSWFTEVIYLALIIRESISILENIEKINPNIIPNWITDRLKNFEPKNKIES